QRDAIVVVATKGIEERTLKLMSMVLEETMPDLEPERLAFLSGPTFAREVAQGLPTDVVVASKGMVAARKVQDLVHSVALRTYTSADPVGVQVGGAVKNVMAVATGACDGLRFGLNARAALITRGLAEMTRLGVVLGADPLTFLGLAGVGDLVLTCTRDLSRNRTLGMRVAEGADPAAYLAGQRPVAEGLATGAAAYDRARGGEGLPPGRPPRPRRGRGDRRGEVAGREARVARGAGGAGAPSPRAAHSIDPREQLAGLDRLPRLDPDLRHRARRGAPISL